MRCALLVLCAAGCVPGTDFAGTEYRCDVDPVCPDGFECSGGVCVQPGGDDGEGVGDVVLIPAGSVEMGCESGAACAADAQPAHQVTVAAFQIDTTEVTEADYAACVADGACDPLDAASGDPDLPARGTAWTDAAAYCAWRGARLPSEAEWERAARGADRRRYPWGDEAPDCDTAALAGCSSGPVAVGELDGRGPFGTADLVGNVAEWVADWYAYDYYRVSPSVDPTGPDGGYQRVIRGGSFEDDAGDLRAWIRGSDEPDDRDFDTGFRCAY